MARQYLCISCNKAFSSEEEFQIHKKGGHKTGGTPLSSPDIPAPTPEFLETIQRIEEKRIKDTTPIENVSPTAPQGAIEAIKLVYKYSGNCPEHNVPVDIVEINIKKIHFAVAVCPVDKKQLQTREVAVLD